MWIFCSLKLHYVAVISINISGKAFSPLHTYFTFCLTDAFYDVDWLVSFNAAALVLMAASDISNVDLSLSKPLHLLFLEYTWRQYTRRQIQCDCVAHLWVFKLRVTNVHTHYYCQSVRVLFQRRWLIGFEIMSETVEQCRQIPFVFIR